MRKNPTIWAVMAALALPVTAFGYTNYCDSSNLGCSGEWAYSLTPVSLAYGRDVFRSACVQHDYCYRHGDMTYGRSKHECDVEFRYRMEDICKGRWWDPSCWAYEYAFYQAVVQFGDSSYQTYPQAGCCEYRLENDAFVPATTSWCAETLPAYGYTNGTSNPVHRFWNGRFHFYSLVQSEGAPAGYATEFVNYFYLSTIERQNTVPFYRCNLPNGSHLYTASESCEGFGRNEGYMGYISTGPAAGAVPLYRLLKNGDHFYTVTWEEFNSARNSGYVSEGVVGYVWLHPTLLP